MLTMEFVLAGVLLCGGDSDSSQGVATEVIAVMPQPVWMPRLAEAVGPSILAFAIDAQVLDPREKWLGVYRLEDLATLQRRLQEMAMLPWIEEADRFPDRKTVDDLLAVNRSYRNQLTLRFQFDSIHADEIGVAIRETDVIYQAFDAVRDSRCDYYFITVRRHALGLLRELIGVEDFYFGRMPPHIPVWHLPRSDPRWR